MLAILERCVTDLGGTYAMEDTDSMAIVATERGGLVWELVGPNKRKRQLKGVRALSWAQVREIVDRFAALNPYDRSIVPGSVLKLEDDNFNPKSGAQRQLWCLAISAKRYALFLRDKNGEPRLLRKGINNPSDRWSEHGLGHLLNPIDPQTEDRAWIGQAWLAIIRRSLGLPTQPLGFEERMAIGRITVSSPAVLRPLQSCNAGKPYSQQIKPFNFLLSCQVLPMGHPIGSDPARFHLIAPYESDARRWQRLQWTDQYSGNEYAVTTTGTHGTRHKARVKSYGDILREYEYHPESKCADTSQAPAGKQTTGLLARRRVEIGRIRYIGKETNNFESVEQGVGAGAAPYTEYLDPRRDEWVTEILPKLKAMSLRRLQRLSGIPRSTLQAIRAGRRPHKNNFHALKTFISNHIVSLSAPPHE